MNTASTKGSSDQLSVYQFFVIIQVLLLFLFTPTAAQTINFASSGLVGENLSNPTSLDFGPDNRLYVSQQNGTINVYTIKKNGSNDYSVSATETILAIKNIPNHNDDGTVNTAVISRQITGILVVGTTASPIVYVSSSDSRIGGGGTGGDQNLDTNSGIISKLTWNGTAWIKVDLVKGLPRSEENHSSNGLSLDAITNTLYLASGGHTNAGSPSNNFAFHTEYALSAAILKIDLNTISSQYGGSYTLPTLDDPTRPNSGPNGSDINDPWGGNDGLNQAKLVPGGPVQIHSAGYRNAYDLVISKAPGKAGRMYTIDNGANSGWGGYPEKEGTSSVTNKYVVGEPGSSNGTLTDAKVNNLDNLHLVSAPSMSPIYGGHPNPIRANPAGAGLYRYDNNTGQGIFSLNPTPDWPPVPVSMANPVEADFRNPGINDGALYTWPTSTNGIAEYTASTFNNALQGDLIASSFDGNLYRIKLNAEGTQIFTVSILAGGFGSQPLDVIAQGDNEAFPGTIWAVTYGQKNVTIIEPVIPTETWSPVTYSTGSTPEARHENGFVEVNGKFYLVGGRVVRNVNIFDPSTKAWTVGAPSPIELNHFQAVAYKNDIYTICAMNGGYPNEVPLTNIYKYSTTTNTWSVGATIPVARRRGSAGVVVFNDKFYIVGGITNGHIDGWVSWVDEYDPATGVWTALPDAPVARDHFMATLINGKIYAAGGRQTRHPDYAANTIASIDVYDIATKKWSSPTNIPTQRGAPGVAYIDGELVIAGGEILSSGAALTVVESYNPTTNSWQTKPSLNIGRHATQMISYQGKLFLCAGSSTRGGSGQNNTMSTALIVANCTGDATNFSIDDDNDGFSNGDETLNKTDPCSAASKPEDADSDGLSNLTDPDDDNDGFNDKVDKFSVDDLNGLNTNLPVNYPFLNGNPGFGLFGLGFTGLMSNNTSDYKDNFDINKANLIMGGAVGVATTPAEAGDPITNNQKYAFQFGINVNQNTPPFTITSKLLGSSFFDGATGIQLGNQSQGIYFGTGDQDNYMKLALHANNGNSGFQILIENNGALTSQNIFPVANILLASSIELFMDINPATGLVQCKYKTDAASSPVNIGPAITLTGNILTVLQNNNAVGVGIIATAGNKSPYTASWDYLNVGSLSSVNAIEIVRINAGGSNLQLGNEVWKADEFFAGGRTFTTTKAIANSTNDALYQSERYGNMTYSIPVPEIGRYSAELHFAEINFQTVGARVFTVDVESGQYQIPDLDLYRDYGAFNAVVVKAPNILVSDGMLTITLTNVVNNAKISGIVVLKDPAVNNLPPVVTKPADTTLHIGQSWSYQVRASDPDAGTILNYSASNLPASLTINPSTGLISGDVSAVPGVYTVNLTVKDQQNVATNSSFVITITNPTTLVEVIRINAGGSNVQAGTQLWKADQYFTGGRIFTTTTAINNTTNDALYQTERYGNMTYSIPVPAAGKYTVELHFAEISFKTAGSRIFTVDVEAGQFRKQDVDLFRDYGGAFNAIVMTAEGIQVNDGMLTISLTNVVNNAKISGIAVFEETSSNGKPPIVTKPADVTLNSGQSWAYQIIASDPDPGSVLSYSAVNLPASLALNTSTGLITGVLTAAPGTYTVDLSVKDQTNLTAKTSFTITVAPANELTEVIRLNAGGPNIQFGNELWKFDQFFTGGNTYSNLTAAISNTTNDALYQSERNGNMSYNIPVPKAGKYTVDLHFAELYHNSAGKRVFNVNIENGKFILNNIDLYRDYGGKFSSAVIKALNIQVDDSALSIVFTNVIDRAKVSGIGVWLQNTTTPNQAPTANAGVDKTIGLPTSSVVLNGSGSDPEDGSNVKYSWSQISGPAAAIFDGLSLASPTVSNLVAGTYVFGLTVTDQQLLSSKIDSVSITVAPAGPTQQVISYTLVNALNEQDILTIPPNSTINLANLPSQSINIRANTNPVTVGSVVFALSGAQTRNYTESGAPYSLFGDSNGNYASWTPVIGDYSLKATPFSSSGGTGTVGIPLTINFKVINQPNRPPVITKPADLILTQGQVYKYNIVASDPDVDAVLTYSATNLPASLSVNAQTGEISGTVTSDDGVFTPTLTVTDQFSLTATTNFVITVKKPNTPPVVTQPADMVAFRNKQFKYQVIASDPEDGQIGIIYSALGLPAGLAIDTTSGEITGTVTAVIGEYTTTLKATDQFGLASADVSFRITVSNINLPPEILSPVDQIATRSQSFNYQVIATDPEDNQTGLFYSATNLPDGLTIDSSTGLISGTVTANTGDYTVSLGVKDKDGLSAVAVNFQIAVKNQNRAPIIVQPGNQEAFRNEEFSLQISASDPDDDQDGLVFSASGLPEGLSINSSNGLIYGTITANIGLYQVVLSVQDQFGLASNSVKVDLTVTNRNQPPTITQPEDLVAFNDEPFSYQVLAYDTEDGLNGLEYIAVGLPTELTINSATGLISGNANTSLGEYIVTLMVKDKEGDISVGVSLKITVSPANQSPTIAVAANQTAAIGNPFEYQVSASDPEDGLVGLSYFATDLPQGLSIDRGNGLISGTVNDIAADYYVKLIVADGAGKKSTESTLLITVIAKLNTPPTLTKPSDQTAVKGDDYNYQILANDPDANSILNYSASGLPNSLNLDGISGLISGTLGGDVNVGAYLIQVTVTDNYGATDTTSFMLSVNDSLQVARTNSLMLKDGVSMTDKQPDYADPFTVFPIPANSEINIKLDVKERSEWKFTLYNTLGRFIQLPSLSLEKGVITSKIDLTPYNLASGVYYLVITNNFNEKKSSKILIQ